MSIQIEDLSYVYNRKSPFESRALDHINLEVAEGEFFAIIGHTGSGKSTLIQHLNALIRVQSGRIRIAEFLLTGKNERELKKEQHKKGERETAKKELKALRGTVGMVFQYPEYQLFAETVEKDVAFGLKNFYAKAKQKKGEETEGITPEEIKERVREAIERVGLDYDEVKDKSPFDLSGGQKRRVAIAGVIVTRPKILVLDEPSAGLDPQGKEEIRELILTLKRTTSPTVVLISHDMDEVARLADRICVLNGGRVEFVLPPRELFQSSRRLEELGLDLPVAVKIARALTERGFDLPPGIVTSEELADAVAASLGGQAR